MSKIADAILKQGTDPELIDVLDQIIGVLNNGRYQLRIIEEEPDFTNNEGEMLIQVSADSTTKKLWFFDGEGWNSVEFTGTGTVATSAIPTGTMFEFGGSTVPIGGYVFCDGTAYSRSAYATLFGVIGTDYGVGDGSTTFNVPDRRGR